MTVDVRSVDRFPDNPLVTQIMSGATLSVTIPGAHAYDLTDALFDAERRVESHGLRVDITYTFIRNNGRQITVTDVEDVPIDDRPVIVQFVGVGE